MARVTDSETAGVVMTHVCDFVLSPYLHFVLCYLFRLQLVFC